MSNQEIRRTEWREFFDEFSRAHERWLATVEVFGDLGAQTVAAELPLVGIVADEPSHGGAVSIVLGRGDETLTHTVARPARVDVERTEEGAEAAVEIESAGGEKTLLRFRSALPPDEIDGRAG